MQAIIRHTVHASGRGVLVCKDSTGCAYLRTEGKTYVRTYEEQPELTTGCGESSLSGAGSVGRKSTVERQHGRRPSTPFWSI